MIIGSNITWKQTNTIHHTVKLPFLDITPITTAALTKNFAFSIESSRFANMPDFETLSYQKL